MPNIFCNTISHTFLERVRQTPNHVGFRHKIPKAGVRGGVWKDVTFGQFFQKCAHLSLGLIRLGLKKGDKAAIISETRFEWALADMAIIGSNAVSIPIYPSNSPSDIAYIINHSEASVVFVEDSRQLKKILEKLPDLPSLKIIVVFEPKALSVANGNQNVLSLDQITELGKQEDVSIFEKNLQSAKSDDIFSICYTSGTTGTPKGAMLRQESLDFVLEGAAKLFKDNIKPEGEVLITFLPFSHILGRLEAVGTFCFGWTECYAENLGKLMTNISEVHPTMFFGVPRIFEKAYTRINALVESGSPLKRKIFSWSLEAGKTYFKELSKSKSASAVTLLKYKIAKALALNKVYARFGGQLKFAICGGAPFAKEMGEFFQAVGISVLEGYGLTETCAAISVNEFESVKFSSVGKVLPEVEIKIAEDGEICIKSKQVFSGYYKSPAATEEAIIDGWFHTGDIGFIDKEGFLHITDRKKDIIVTSGGKNIAPQKIESLAKRYSYISQFVVYGDKRNYLTALVTLDKDQITEFGKNKGVSYTDYSQLLRSAEVHALVKEAIVGINQQLATFESVKKFVIIPEDFSVEAGELTPSLKVKRTVVGQKYQVQLNSLYS